jgi:hypothetical protein
MSFGTRRELKASYDETLAKIPEALKAEGFGILTEFDVRETLKNKIGVAFVGTRSWVHATHRWRTKPSLRKPRSA